MATLTAKDIEGIEAKIKAAGLAAYGRIADAYQAHLGKVIDALTAGDNVEAKRLKIAGPDYDHEDVNDLRSGYYLAINGTLDI